MEPEENAIDFGENQYYAQKRRPLLPAPQSEWSIYQRTLDWVNKNPPQAPRRYEPRPSQKESFDPIADQIARLNRTITKLRSELEDLREGARKSQEVFSLYTEVIAENSELRKRIEQLEDELSQVTPPF